MIWSDFMNLFSVERHFHIMYIEGTKGQSWARDNTVATLRPCCQATKLFVIVILLYLEWLLHLDTDTEIFFDFFWSLRLCCITLSRCCCKRSYTIVACPALLRGPTLRLQMMIFHVPRVRPCIAIAAIDDQRILANVVFSFLERLNSEGVIAFFTKETKELFCVLYNGLIWQFVVQSRVRLDVHK